MDGKLDSVHIHGCEFFFPYLGSPVSTKSSRDRGVITTNYLTLGAMFINYCSALRVSRPYTHRVILFEPFACYRLFTLNLINCNDVVFIHSLFLSCG